MPVTLRFVYIYICRLTVYVWKCLWKTSPRFGENAVTLPLDVDRPCFLGMAKAKVWVGSEFHSPWIKTKYFSFNKDDIIYLEERSTLTYRYTLADSDRLEVGFDLLDTHRLIQAAFTEVGFDLLDTLVTHADSDTACFI